MIVGENKFVGFIDDLFLVQFVLILVIDDSVQNLRFLMLDINKFMEFYFDIWE